MILKVFALILLLLFSNIHAQAYVDKVTLNKITKKYKIFAKKRFYYLQVTLDGVKDGSDIQKLQAVNEFYNGVRYSPDIKVYKKKDYWATPYEFLGKDRGDCEDYVISKYFALLYLGVDAKKLFFTYVRSKKFKAPHMVLTYFKTSKSEPLVLDNTNRKILPASKRTDLIPIYNFNGDSLYKASAKGSGKKLKKQKSHKKWDQLKANMKKKKI